MRTTISGTGIVARSLQRLAAVVVSLALVSGGAPHARPLPPVTFHAHGQAPFGWDRFHGQWVVLVPGTTQCQHTCTDTMTNVQRALGGLAAEPLQVVFLSVDPLHEGPVDAGCFATAFDQHYVGVTVSSADLSTLCDVLGFERRVDGKGRITGHSVAVYLVDPQGRWVNTYAGRGPSTVMASDVRRHLSPS